MTSESIKKRGILSIKESIEMLYITRDCMENDEIIFYLKKAIKNHKK